MYIIIYMGTLISDANWKSTLWIDPGSVSSLLISRNIGKPGYNFKLYLLGLEKRK
jgi:hypothetical protein